MLKFLRFRVKTIIFILKFLKFLKDMKTKNQNDQTSKDGVKKFDNLEDAMTHFLENEYPKLKPEEKVKDAKYDFQKRGSISHNKIEYVIQKYGSAKVKFEITFED